MAHDCTRVSAHAGQPVRAPWWRRAMPAVLLLAAAAPVSANTGMFWVVEMTPQFAGYAYLALIVAAETLALWRIAGLRPLRALLWCVGANILSGAVGFFFLTWVPMVLYPAELLWLPLRPLVGDLNDPVNRLVAICTAFFVVSALVEGAVYHAAYAMASGKAPRRIRRAAVAGNAVSNGLALLILLCSPRPYQMTTCWQWYLNNGPAAEAALEQYRAAHQGQLPAGRGPLAVSEALLPYIRRDRGAILRGGKVVNYDRPRWRRDWPELRMELRSDEKDGWRVVAPDVVELWFF